MMKVGLLGPGDVVDRTHAIIKKECPETELIDFKYTSYMETPDIVKRNQKKVDAFLFPGKTPFKLTESMVRPTIPWEFMPRQGSTLLRALLEASHIRKLDIARISFDTYTADMLYEAYQEIGVKKESLHIYIAEQRLTDQYYYEYLMEFHRRNYYEHGAACCITGITEIYESLNRCSIPCIRTTATANTILLTYHKLELKYLAQTNQNSQIVVIAIRLDLPNFYSVERSEEYVYLLKKNKVLEKIYLFASKIEAAVAENTDREFLLFTTKKILESETSDLQDIYLLDLLRETIATNVNIGIGYGETAREAKYNAYEGVARAIKSGGNVTFAVYGCGKVRGPFRFYRREENHIDKEFHKISRETGISNNTLFKIYKTMMKSNAKEFTSKELALACNMSKRSMDRLIYKLEAAGYCEIVGETMTSGSGRPSRIIRLVDF